MSFLVFSNEYFSKQKILRESKKSKRKVENNALLIKNIETML